MSADWVINENIRDNSIIKGLLERIPKDERDLFSDEQLIILKSAIGARQWGVHPIDLRWTIKFWRWRYYFVVLSGVSRRSPGRRVQELELMGKTILLFSILFFSVSLGILVLYLIKSAMGIDIIPGFSFGVWGWFKETFL